MSPIDLAIFVTLMALGYGFGSYAERRHFKSILTREAFYQNKVLTFSVRNLPPQTPAPDVMLVTGNVVISIDYFKQFVATLRKIVGGRITSFESLIERARREAILRMKEQAYDMGADAVFNVKIETSSISRGAKGQVGSVEVLAYGTAVIRSD
jgi:uncharacterized protein YbjQ (UPF0145 family)